MLDPLSIAISELALGISAVNAWLTLWRRGAVRMTQPTVTFFGPDTPRNRSEPSLPKVYLRTLPFSTSKKGRVIESMHAALSRNETHQNFNIWVHATTSLCAAAAYTLAKPRDNNAFRFDEGRYRLSVYAHLLGDRNATLLFSQTLEISQANAGLLKEPGTGLYFDWGLLTISNAY